MKGEIANLAVQKMATEKGWIVSKPTTEARYDLILDDGHDLHKVQIKYCDNKRKAVYLTKYNGRHNYSKDRKKYTREEVDVIIVYSPCDGLIWLKDDLFDNKTCVTLTESLIVECRWV